MKKGLFLLLTLLCVTFLLIGCGGNPGGNSGAGDSISAQLNARIQSVTALQEVAKSAENAGQNGRLETTAGASSSLFASEEPSGEGPEGTEHGPKWTGPDVEGWYSSTQWPVIPGETHVWKVKMKIQDDTTTLYKLEDTVTFEDGSVHVGTEETKLIKGANGLVSGESSYTRYYRFSGIEYEAIATQTFSNFSSDGTGSYTTNLTLNTENLLNPENVNHLTCTEVLNITLKPDKTMLHVSGTITDSLGAYDYVTDWPLVPTT